MSLSVRVQHQQSQDFRVSSTIVTVELIGVFAPVPTPLDEGDRLDTAKFRPAFDWWLQSGLSGLVVLGSSGEAALLDEDESERVVGAARDLVPPGRPLIVGAGRESTRATVRAVGRAAALGADAVLVRTPAFFKPQMTADVLVRHYTTVADGSPVPVILYNFPALTGVNLAPVAVSRLSEHPNVMGVKESSGDIGQIADLVAGTPDGFSVLAGSAATFYPALAVGAAGGILALACVLPGACVQLFDLVKQQRYREARILQRRLVPLVRLLGSSHGVPALKAALKIIGLDLGFPRPPLEPLTDSGTAALRNAIVRLQEVAA
jgi:4-hydroxy-2-oxoglutarate aldolase